MKWVRKDCDENIGELVYFYYMLFIERVINELCWNVCVGLVSVLLWK